MPNDNGTSCRPLVLLAIVVAAVMFVFPLFVPFPLMDPDEGLHASVAQEMVERGDWVVPRFLGEPFFDKPIFYFWVQAVSLRLFGSNELAVRLPGLLFGLLGAATTGLLAGRMFGRKTGWIAGIFYATTILPTALAQAASHDVALVPWVNLAILLLWECAPRIPHTPCVDAGTRSVPSTVRVAFCTVGAGVFLGLSILTKGLLGVAVVGLAYGGYLLIARRVTPGVVLQGAAVLAIAVLVAAPWYLAVEWRERVVIDSQERGFLYYYFLERHVFGFATGKQPHSDQPWWYYLPILLGGGLPWIAYTRWARGAGRVGSGRQDEGETPERIRDHATPTSESVPLLGTSSAGRTPSPWHCLFQAVAHVAKKCRLDADFPSPVAFLWFWLIAWTVFLTVAQSKLVTYLWPAFPPLAILAAVAWTRLIDGSLGEAARRAFARSFVSSSWSGPIVLPAAVAVLQWVLAIRFDWPVWLAVVLVAAASPLPLIPWRAGRRQASMAAAALSLAAQFVVVMTLILPRLAEMYSARDLAEYFNRKGSVPSRLFVVEERIGSLVFYLNPRLRAGLAQDQIQYLPTDPPTQLQPGDIVAFPLRKRAQAAEWLDLGDNPYEPVGRYWLYRIAKPQAAE